MVVLTGQSYANNTINIKVNEKAINFTEELGQPFIDNGRTLVPLRAVVTSLDAQVEWDGDLRQAVVTKNDTTVKVTIDQSFIFKNNQKIANDSKAVIVKGRTFLPIRVVMEAFDYQVHWEGRTRSILINENNKKGNKKSIKPLNQRITVNERSIQVNGYKVDLKNKNLEVKTALAKGQVGQVDTLENIAKENDALLAINGSYFAAYDDTEIKDPYGILVVDGKIVHNSNKRATIGFKDNQVDIDYVDTKIKGANGEPTWKYSWNGYWLNHTVIENGVSLTVYDNNRGEETNSLFGRNYIVEDGIITKIVDNQSVKIPKNGYVANLYGVLGNTPSEVYDRFKIGYPFKYDVTLKPEAGNDKFWNTLDYATGAGPALIINGKITIDYEKEGFVEKKITEFSSARSAIGYTADDELIFVTTTATMNELAEIMKNLGCIEAMNLDGGASSGLYHEGQYIRKPGRDISNIIYIQ
jgi:exopolysaccharide biosynthesis protein